MSDSDNEEVPNKRRARGPYKKYLEPGNRFIIPESTLRSRLKASTSKTDVDQEEFAIQPAECEDREDLPKSVSKDETPCNSDDEQLSHLRDDEFQVQLPDHALRNAGKKRRLNPTSDDDESVILQTNSGMEHVQKEKGLSGQMDSGGKPGSGGADGSSGETSDTEQTSGVEGLSGQIDSGGKPGSGGADGSSSESSDTEQTSGDEGHGFSYYTCELDEEDSVHIVQASKRDDEARRETVECLAVCTCGMCPENAADEIDNLSEEEAPAPEENVRQGGNDSPEEIEPQEESASQEENDSLNDRRQKWKRKYDWDEPVHSHLSVTKFAVFLMLFHLFIRRSMSYALVEDILKFVNCILGSDVLSTSQYLFKKLFQPNCKMLTHVYCPSCSAYLGELNELKESVTCECGEESRVKDLKDNNHCFITIGVTDSLKYFMRRPNVKLIPPKARVEGEYKDVMDGDMYHRQISPEIQKGKNVMSITFNTDGAKVFKSNKMSMWPIQFLINELDPRERFKDANIFLAGMWYGRGSPNMSTFLKPLISELEFLAECGVELVTSTGKKMLYHVYALLCSVDSGAKPKLLRQKAHNGKCSCGFCLHPNMPVPGFPQNQLRFLEKDERGRRLKFADRTHRSMIKDMLKADDLDRKGKLKAGKDTFDNVHGLLGISCLAVVPKFDLARGFVVDYLHTLLLGVMSALLKLLFDDKEQRTEDHDPSSQIRVVESRLSSIKPPHCMATRSRLFSERSDWKGKELRLFALVYALPCFNGLAKFSPRHFQHLQKFVTALQILLGSVIMSEQLLYAERLLDEFVVEFQDIYGAIHMTLNIHLLKHVVNVVRWWGPLWCYSNFAFESGNGRLARLVRGTQGVISQICEKYLAILTVSDFLKEHPVSKSVLEFCSNVMSYSYVKKSEKIDEFTRVLDGEKILKLSTDSEDQVAIMASGIASLMDASEIQFYNRVVYKGTVYYSKAYTRPEIFDDTCVKLTEGTYAITEKFIKTSESSVLYVIIRPIQLSVNDDNLAPLILTGAFNFFGPLRVVAVNEIVKKCVCIQLGNHQNYVCELPNDFERD